jgi:signal transduction histidine kinase
VLRNLSYRYKIPLRGTALVLVTAALVTALLIVRAYQDLQNDLLINSEGMSRVLARTLVPAMLRDDVWQSYEIITSPLHGVPHKQGIHPDIVILLNAHQQVYVSTQPPRFPMLSELRAAGAEFGVLQERVKYQGETAPTAVDLRDSSHIYMITHIVSDGVPLGTLIMGYSKSLFIPRFYNFASRAALATLIVLGVLLPVSWYWGSRMAEPLVHLSECMGQVGSTIPHDLDCQLYESNDEIGRLSTQFRRMLIELRDKQALERQMVVADRLAALGRLTAGIAHEINNPLGGMLNAINTFKHHGNIDPRTVKTMSLLERGLLQIKDTVGALLVEARPEEHGLTPQDLEDVRTLAFSHSGRPTAHFDWMNEIGTDLPLPATPVRQVLINLLLNALQAVDPDGYVTCRIWQDSCCLHVEVINSGRYITADQIEHLFEPFSSHSDAGNGLGLWMTYQIVQQLGGKIRVESGPGRTCFGIELPLGTQHA